jgi:hypothetical protein
MKYSVYCKCTDPRLDGMAELTNNSYGTFLIPRGLSFSARTPCAEVTDCAPMMVGYLFPLPLDVFSSNNEESWSELGFDFLACGACILFPRSEQPSSW